MNRFCWFASCDKRLAKCISEIDDLSRSIPQLTGALEPLNQTVSGISGSVSALVAEVASLGSHASSIASSINLSYKQSVQAIEDFRKKVEELNTELKEFPGELRCFEKRPDGTTFSIQYKQSNKKSRCYQFLDGVLSFVLVIGFLVCLGTAVVHVLHSGADKKQPFNDRDGKCFVLQNGQKKPIELDEAESNQLVFRLKCDENN